MKSGSKGWMIKIELSVCYTACGNQTFSLTIPISTTDGFVTYVIALFTCGLKKMKQPNISTAFSGILTLKHTPSGLEKSSKYVRQLSDIGN